MTQTPAASEQRGVVRILFATQVELGARTGGARHADGLVRSLVRAGHGVTVVAPGSWSPPDGAAHVRTRRTSPGARLEAELALRVSEATLVRVPDVGYVRLCPSTSAVPATMRALSLPFATELNGAVLDELKARGRDRQAKIAAWTLRWAAEQGPLVAVEPSIAEHARSALGARDVHVIENGADLEVARPGDRAEARRRLGVPDGLWLGFAGTLAPELRLDLLLPLLERLDAHLLVAGGGPGRALLDHPRVRALGEVSHGVAVDVLRACDVCVSVREGWAGLRPIEALATGRRVVLLEPRGSERLVSAAAPLPEFVHVSEHMTEAGLEAAIRAALRAQAEHGDADPRRLKEVRAQLGWEQTAVRLAALLQSIARARG